VVGAVVGPVVGSVVWVEQGLGLWLGLELGLGLGLADALGQGVELEAGAGLELAAGLGLADPESGVGLGTVLGPGLADGCRCACLPGGLLDATPGTGCPPLPPAALDWAPTAHYGGYHPADAVAARPLIHQFRAHSHGIPNRQKFGEAIWGVGCDCFAF